MESNIIAAYIESCGESVDREELIGLFGDSYDVPDYDTLADRYIAGRIAQDLSRARDDDKRRVILAARDKDKIKYVYIHVCRNVELLTNIQQRTQHEIDGRTASLEKVEFQLEDCYGKED